MKRRTIRLVYILVLFGWCAIERISCNVDNMYKVIKGDVELLEDAIDDFEIFFTYALPECPCIQVISDHSPFAEYHLDDLHQCLSVPALVSGLFDGDEGCEVFVILTTSIATVPSTLEKLFLHAEHRFIVIAPTIDMSNLEVDNQLTYGEAEILMIATQNLSVALKLGQPDRKRFEVVDNFTVPWIVNTPPFDKK